MKTYYTINNNRKKFDSIDKAKASIVGKVGQFTFYKHIVKEVAHIKRYPEVNNIPNTDNVFWIKNLLKDIVNFRVHDLIFDYNALKMLSQLLLNKEHEDYANGANRVRQISELLLKHYPLNQVEIKETSELCKANNGITFTFPEFDKFIAQKIGRDVCGIPHNLIIKVYSISQSIFMTDKENNHNSSYYIDINSNKFQAFMAKKIPSIYHKYV